MADTTPWRIELDPPRLVGPYDLHYRYTKAEFDRQQWPPCPVCGETIEVEPIDVTGKHEADRTYITGRWQCPRGCDPRKAG